VDSRCWAVTSTLHQKLKFVRNGKLVTVHGEEAYLVSQVSSFSCVEAGSTEGTSFQGLTVEGAEPRRASATMASLKDAQKAVQEVQAAGWGKVIQILENKRKEGLGQHEPSIVLVLSMLLPKMLLKVVMCLCLLYQEAL
jgi:hypothetical protein